MSVFPGRLLRIISRGYESRLFIPVPHVGNKGTPPVDTHELNLYNSLYSNSWILGIFGIFFVFSVNLHHISIGAVGSSRSPVGSSRSPGRILQGAKPRSPLWTSTCPDFWAAREPDADLLSCENRII